MRRIILAIMSGAGLGAVMLLGAGASSAGATTLPDHWCSAVAPPCIVSATRNGAAVPDHDATYWIDLEPFADRGSSNFSVNVESLSTSDSTLGPSSLSDVWTIVVNTGTMIPRVVSGYAGNVTFTRSPQAGGTYLLTLTGSPVTIADNSPCNFSGSTPTCPYQATRDFVGYLSFQVGDYDLPSLYTASQIASFYGMNLTTNIDETGLPPSIQYDSSTGTDELVLQLANQHLLADSSLFTGFLHLRIPNAFLQTVYGVDDPTTITDNGLSTSIGAGVITVAEEPGNQALLVDITGVTFSRRTLTIRRGVITPGRPAGVHAHRIGSRRGKVSFHRVKPRGSRITYYQLSCTSTSSHHTASARSSGSPITIGGLVPGLAYRCTVRAHAKAGFGPRSAVRLPA